MSFISSTPVAHVRASDQSSEDPGSNPGSHFFLYKQLLIISLSYYSGVARVCLYGRHRCINASAEGAIVRREAPRAISPLL